MGSGSMASCEDGPSCANRSSTFGRYAVVGGAASSSSITGETTLGRWETGTTITGGFWDNGEAKGETPENSALGIAVGPELAWFCILLPPSIIISFSMGRSRPRRRQTIETVKTCIFVYWRTARNRVRVLTVCLELLTFVCK